MGIGRIVGMGKKVLGGAGGMARDLAIWGVGMPMLSNVLMGGGSETPPPPGQVSAPEYYIDPNTRHALQENFYLQQMAGVNSIAKG